MKPRVPPHDLGAEEATLGVVLAHGNDAYLAALDAGLTIDAFYKPAHRAVFAAITATAPEIDEVTVAGEMNGTDPAIVTEVMRGTPSRSLLGNYVAAILETWTSRRLLHAAAEATEQLYDGDTAADVAARLVDGVTSSAAAAGARCRAPVLTVGELRNVRPPTPLIPALVDLDSLTVLYGPPAVGKSLFTLDMCCRVATGAAWHSSQPIESGAVMLVAAEGAHGTAPRLDAWKATTGQPDDPTDLWVLPEPVNLLSDSSLSTLTILVERLQPVLVVIDTLARCMVGGDENSARDMGVAVHALDRIRRVAGSAVIVVHHSGKDRSAGARGSSALHGAADTMLSMTERDGTIKVAVEKQKHHPKGEPQRFRLTPTAGSVAITVADRQVGDRLTDKTREALSVLEAIATEEGVSWTGWKKAAGGVSNGSLGRAKKKAFEQSLIGFGTSSTEQAPRYVITPKGSQHLAGTTDTTGNQAFRPRPASRSHEVPTSPTPLAEHRSQSPTTP